MSDVGWKRWGIGIRYEGKEIADGGRKDMSDGGYRISEKNISYGGLQI